jgi:hypothetical protein
VGDNPHLKYQKKKNRNMGDHNEEKEDFNVLHILNDLAKGPNEMRETFARGQRELIDTLTQLLNPLGNKQGLNTNGDNGQARFHAEGSNSGATDNGHNRPQAEGSNNRAPVEGNNSHVSMQSMQWTTSGGRHPDPSCLASLKSNNQYNIIKVRISPHISKNTWHLERSFRQPCPCMTTATSSTGTYLERGIEEHQGSNRMLT